ncbi:restriction endonuclease subunit S [Citrobacter sp.]|uniref:restriction endonuclease subunit S n=1 Tax=Citrobacter sp. TaxID=1896336 RepID=UPI00258A4F89|nr:restriction endonuclease subunit S [Citrobacter sp.]
MDAQQFLAEFGHIANAPGGIGKLRELILHLAVQGKLIVSTASDVSSRVLLDEVRAIKAELVSCKKLPREKPYPEVLRREIAADAPSHWEWVRFGELWQLLSGRDLEPSKYNDFKNGIPYITGASNIDNGVIAVNRWTPDPVVVSITGDLLITCKGTIGKTAFNTLGEVHIARQIMAVRDFSGKLDTGFLKIWLDGFVSQLVEKSKSMIPGFSRDDLVLAAYPVLPIDEQSRIVAKVGELMALLDKLEAQQQACRKLQNVLRQSILQAIVSTTSPHELQTNWTRLTNNFGRLFHTPEDVDELRKAVLDLAVSGYLSNPDQLDEPSSTLKAKILAAKVRGIADGSFSRKKHVKPEKLEETVLPAHWECITLDEAISTIDAGWSPACLPNARDDENKWAVLKTTAVQVLRFLPHEHKELPASLDPRPQYQIEIGDILITRAGPRNRVGICCVADTAPARLMISDKLIRFHIVDDLINPRFVAVCLSAGEPGRTVERLKSGMAESQMNISQDKLRSITIPLPPIEEQWRILEKIELLMKIIDSYSERLCKENKLAAQVAAASVSSITGIAIEQEEEPMKAPQIELIAPLRLGTAPDIKAQAPLATILARHHGEMSAKDLWQRFGGEIDAFYAQLKTEVTHGWIKEPTPAEVREKPANMVSA